LLPLQHQKQLNKQSTMIKKYELIESDKEGLFRIKALRDFCIGIKEIKKGDIGGYVASEDNLSHEGEYWIFDDAMVYDNAQVTENAFVCGNVQIYENALVKGNTFLGEDAKVYGNAVIDRKGYLCGNVQIYGDAVVEAHVHGQAQVYEHALVCGHAYIGGNAKVYGFATIDDYAHVADNAEICGEVRVDGNAVVSSLNDYMTIKNNWSSGRWFTWTRSNDMWKVGCFHGTGEKLIKKAYADSYEKGRCYEATVKYVKTINIINSSNNGE
jgi:acyl-[acyl carrier protein]--UDP-N-acetylglucosamine O-acyltransferase